MFRNYLLVAIRNLFRQKLYSAINILGLAIGMACCILIMLFIQYELSYDRVHEKRDQIYRVIREERRSGGNSTLSSGTSGALAPALLNDFPEVQQAIRLVYRTDVWMRYGDRGFAQRFALADAAILEVFNFPMVKGDPKTALQSPYSVVVTQEMAEKYFGKEDPIGKMLTVDDERFGGEFRVTGILQNIPKNSTIHFDFLTSILTHIRTRHTWASWLGVHAVRHIQTYIMLPNGYSSEELEGKLPDFMEKYMGEEVRKSNTYYLQPLTRAYLFSRHYSNVNLYDSRRGDISQVYLLSSVAFFLMLIACINFMNLATARSATRAKEVGMRKVVGANRPQLIQQFLGESMLISLMALVLAVGLAELSLPEFNTFMQKNLSLNLGNNVSLLLGFLGLALVVGFLAGSYPAFFLSAFQPAEVLKGSLRSGSKGAWFRKGLVVFQFSISTLLMVGTAVVYNQLAYIRTKSLGYNAEHVVILGIYAGGSSVVYGYEAVKQQLLQHPDVLSAAAHRHSRGLSGHYRLVRPEGMYGDELRIRVNEGDKDFLETFEMELVAGRNFTESMESENRFAWILNEAAVQKFGWTDPIGKQFELMSPNRKGTVVGVVKDFHGASLHEKIGPVAVMKLRKPNFISVRIRGDNILETMAFLEKKMRQFIPLGPLWFQFMDDHMGEWYDAERRQGKVLGVFSLLAISIACLGLFGLASFMAEKRTKEIGIRKVLGASISSILLLLSKDFVKLAVLANLIAWPAAYYAMDRWLQAFAYRIDLDVVPFIFSGILGLAIVLSTVGFQAFKAARANPVEALRYE